tara:strand:+ start:5704 stop:6579 length:876 start_codon:yes stop_codon:yes gene_type:complete
MNSIRSIQLSEEQYNDIKRVVDLNGWLNVFDRYESFTELWCFCDEPDQNALVEELIGRFHYIDENMQFDMEKAVAKKIEEEWGLIPTNTIITSTSEDGEVDGGAWAMQQLKNKLSIKLGWKENNLFSSIGIASHNILPYSTIVLIDDFTGSGKTLVNKVNYIKKIIKQKNIKEVLIKVVAFAAMEKAKVNITTNAVPELDFFSPLVMSKGISSYYSGKECIAKKNLMTKLEYKLSDKFNYMSKSDYKFGFKKSEALFQRGAGNCPNNVFPIFWWPKLKDENFRSTLFKRIK